MKPKLNVNDKYIKGIDFISQSKLQCIKEKR